jgi:hypothetical protein
VAPRLPGRRGHDGRPRAARSGGGALLIRALAAARERLYQQGRNAQPVPPPAESPAAAPALNQQPPDALILLADGDLPDDVPTLDQHGVYELALLAPMIPPADVPTMDQQQADALALLAETALHHELDPGAPGERYQVVVHVPPCSRTRASLASPSWRAACAFSRERRSGWRVTRAGW